MNHVDYFGNPIEEGDIVIRNCSSIIYLAKVLRITKKSIGLSRSKWQKRTTKPLYVKYFSGINLSKLDDKKIQEIIKSFINEI